jgi:hypothetical protein
MNASKVWQTQDGIKSAGVNGTIKKQGRPRNRSEGREERKEDKGWIKNDNWRPEDVNGAKKTKNATSKHAKQDTLPLISLPLVRLKHVRASIHRL